MSRFFLFKISQNYLYIYHRRPSLTGSDIIFILLFITAGIRYIQNYIVVGKNKVLEGVNLQVHKHLTSNLTLEI